MEAQTQEKTRERYLPQKPLGTTECQQCETQIERIRPWHKFCSDDCRRTWHQERYARAMALLEQSEAQA